MRNKVDLQTRSDEEENAATQQDTEPSQRPVVAKAYKLTEHYFEFLVYFSVAAILGSTLRVYMARIFGSDCQAEQASDFLVPFSSRICVTNNGRTEQTGGALFTDFPANFLGSFLMGMMNPLAGSSRAKLPWLHRDHPLQRDEVFYTSLTTGFCGCLTTFASWNTQMVVMLDGKYSQLGSQVIPVLFGYFVGFMGASYGFQFGRQCNLWMYNYRHKDDGEVSSNNDIPQQNEEGDQLQAVPSHPHKIPLVVAAVALLIAFIAGDAVSGIEFYRGMILLWILSPLGALCRWKLSDLNKKKGVIKHAPDWIPWGTFSANFIATILSACIEGLYHRYFYGADPTLANEWVAALLFALKTGVAGSLSTVSTMVKESTLLAEANPDKAHGHLYSILTCVTCCLMGLAVYSTTIRVN